MKNLYKWAINLLHDNNKASLDATITLDQIINEYVLENHGKIIQIDSTEDMRKVQGNGLDQLVIPELLPRGEIVGRYEPDTKFMFLIPTKLKSWMGERQINYQQFEKDVIKHREGHKKRMRLTKGTPLSMASFPCLIFKCDIDEETLNRDVTENL